MYLTATFKIRANDHDRHRFDAALRRWHHAMRVALDNAALQRKDFVSCVRWWEPSPEKMPDADQRRAKARFVVDGPARHSLILQCCRVRTHLHSSASMSLVRALEETVGSWLGLYARWLQGGRKEVKPSWPQLPPLSALEAQSAWEMALENSQYVLDLASEDEWRAEVTRGAHNRPLPMDFGAMTAGAHDPKGKSYLHHAGLLKRQDGRHFGLLTLWPAGDPLGETITRANNRSHEGSLQSVRSEREWKPGERSRAAICCPLEMGRGHKHLFLGRGKPQSAQLRRRGDDYYFDVAFEFADHLALAKTGAILGLRRGINTLIAAVVVDGQGTVMERARFDGRDLSRLIDSIHALRAKRQQKGGSTAGDRRAARVAEHHVYSVCHQVIDLAYRHGAETFLLTAPRLASGEAARPRGRGNFGPGTMLKHRHFAQIEENLAYLFAECGLPAAQSWSLSTAGRRTCLGCGWSSGDTVRHPEAQEGECPGCRRRRDDEMDAAEALALDVLRCRRYTDRDTRPTLGEFVREIGRKP